MYYQNAMLELFCLKIFQFINAVQTSIDTVHTLEPLIPEAEQLPLVPSISKKKCYKTNLEVY